MKKIIGIVIATLLLSNIGLASIKEIEKKFIKGTGTVTTICIDNHMFAVVRDGKGISMVQFLMTVNHYNRYIGTALPVTCR